MNETAETAKENLANFLNWLEQDSENTALLTDAVAAAVDADELDKADELLSTYSEKNELTPELLNLAGLTALRKQDFDQASRFFESLLDDGHDDPTIRFNLAWSRAVTNHRGPALGLLDDEMVGQLPQAAALKVHLLHADGQFEEAFDEAKELAEIHPDDPGLMAAISVLAMDVEDPDLAKKCAEKAGAHPDALTTLGTLKLGEHDLEAARQKFSQALSLNQRNPRAWIGQGLVHLSVGNKKEALADLDKGAEFFDSHIGSWIAAGWAYLLNDDREMARERFMKALSLDPAFAESQGSLAVLDVLDDDMKNAEKRCETALRLDRKCFSAALAKSLILQAQGDNEKAQRIITLTLNTPIDHSDRTLADNLVQMSGGVPTEFRTIN